VRETTHGESAVLTRCVKNAKFYTLTPDFQAHLDAEASQLRKQMYAAGFDVDSGLSVVKDRSGVNRPESASLNLVDTLERQFPGVGEAYYRRSSGFVHGAPWALALAQGWLGADVSSPRLSATVVTDAFLLVGVAVNNAIQLSASYSGIPFRLVTKRLTRILDMTQGELRRLNEPRVRQPHLGPARALSPKWAAMVARAWGHEPASELDGRRSRRPRQHRLSNDPEPPSEGSPVHRQP
jgi:hypothetical protein